MNRHELALRNRALAEARTKKDGPRSPFPFLTQTPRRVSLDTPPRRILALCTGDPAYALFATPAIYALRTAFPNAHLSAATGLESEPFLRHNRDLDQLHVVPVLGYPTDVVSARHLSDWPEMFESERYDAAIVMSPKNWIAALLTARARVPRRFGVSDERDEGFLTHPVTVDPGLHAVTQNLRLVETLIGAPSSSEPRLRFWTNDSVTALAYRSTFAGLLDDTRLLVALHPGDGSKPADWHAEGWALVADHLILHYDANVLLLGDDSRASVVHRHEIARRMRFEPTILEGTLDPLFASALFARCALIIGGHSGLLHLAVALDRPSVLLYGPHDSAEVGPWGEAARFRLLRSSMPCAPCHLPEWPDDALDNHPCVRDVESYAVLDTTLDLLSSITGPPLHESVAGNPG